MRAFITTIFSLLLLVTFVAPVAIDFSGIDTSIAFAQEAEEQSAGFFGTPLVRTIQFFGSFFITIGAFLLWLAGILFNYGIQYGILEFANFANISGIPVAWTLLRDLTNILFIFIFLAIGIGTILNTSSIGSTKLLPKLLIIAVLVNFSLFFTKVGIDVAHSFAGAILNQSGVVAAECNSVSGNCGITYGPATAFIETFGFVNFFGASAEDALVAGSTAEGVYESIFSGDSYASAGRALLFGILSFVFMTAAAIVLFGGAMILIIRIVKLLLLMITAAPAMAAMILDGTQKYWKMWFNTLVTELLYAPILLLLLAISLLFLNTARVTFGPGSDPTASFAQVFINGNSDSASLIIFFLIALGFLFMSIQMAGKIGGQGAGTIQAFASRRVARLGGGLAGGTLGALGRNTVGRLSGQAAQSFAKTKIARKGYGRVAMAGLKNLEAATYDPRGIAGVQGAARANLGSDLGDTGKGFAGRAADTKKAREKYAGTLKQTEEEKETEKLVKTELDTFNAVNKDKMDNLEKERAEKLKIINSDADLLTKNDAEADRIEIDKKLAELKKEKSELEKGLQAAKNAPQLEYATNLEKESLLTQQGSIPELVRTGKKGGMDKAQQEHYKKLEGELKGLRQDLKSAVGADREQILINIAKKNAETQELLKENQEKTATAISNIAVGFGGGASAAQGNIDAAQAIRNAALKTKDDKEKDRDAIAKAIKEASKGDS